MYDNQIKTATRQANVSFVLLLVLSVILGIAIGALYSNQIFQFINYLIN